MTKHPRRFTSIIRLYGEPGFLRLQAAHVVVVGIGGVGSWATEALARSGVGMLTLIDLDHIAESNINRQIHALENTLGQAKTEAMRARIQAINPVCQVRLVDDFLTPDNVDTLLAYPATAVIDAIDQVRAKCALIAWAKRARTPLVVCGGAGGKTDPSKLATVDLASTQHDPLLSSVRAHLRKHYGFSRHPGQRFGVPAVYSSQPLDSTPSAAEACPPVITGSGLACTGYGSAMHITASIGLLAAGWVMNHITSTSAHTPPHP